MPRRKRNKFRMSTKDEILAAREVELTALRKNLGFIELWNFLNWQRYFLDKESYLDELERWINEKIAKPNQAIKPVTDVDRGLMRPYVHQPTARKSNYWQGEWGGYDGDDDPWEGWESGKGYVRKPHVPLTPKIEAPSGHSGVAHIIF